MCLPTAPIIGGFLVARNRQLAHDGYGVLAGGYGQEGGCAMRFVYYDDLDSGRTQQFGIEVFGVIYRLADVIQYMRGVLNAPDLPEPDTIWAYHALAPAEKARLHETIQQISALDPAARSELIKVNIRWLSPVPQPRSLRCFSSFEGHTRAVRQRRGLSMPTEWFSTPVFQFGNHNAIYPHGGEVPQSASFWLDFEMQVACVIGKRGINIRAEQADDYIAGYTILNDWCARDLEMYEMRMGLGPAKGRDFAVSLGPTLVTPDELSSYAIGEGAQQRYDLKMSATVNNKPLFGLQTSTLRTIHFTFAQMIERASADAWLFPGDVLASGAVDNGSLLSLGAEETLGRWLQTGDVVDLEVEGLGVLRNTVAPPIM
jgi:fumarylacetoacetate (FAA) hydrolase